MADDAVERHADLVEQARASGVRVALAPARSLAELADTVTPQGVIAVCRDRRRVAGRGAWPVRRVWWCCCDQIRDPGNLGTVIRCADAFGADAVLVSTDSVDLYNAKAVRASTGSVFHLPITVGVAASEAIRASREAGLTVLGADGGASSSIEDLGRDGGLARSILWVLGNEAWGLPSEHVELVDRLVALPLYGRAESLNLSTAAAVLLYLTATAQRAASAR